MSEIIKGGSARIRYEGIIEWDELYSLITNWLNDKKFDYYEKNNVKKEGTYGYEKELKAVCERDETGYMRHIIEINIHAYHMEDFEVAVNGKKEKKTKTGMMVIDLTPSIELDWQHKWDERLKKKAREFFHKYLIKGYIYEQLDKLYYEMYKLHTKIKESLDMENKYSAY